MYDASDVLITAVVSGLVMGSVYALAAVGLTIIFGVLRVVNFAHGEFLMLGAYSTFFLVNYLGVDPYFLLPVTFVLFFTFGVLVQRTLIRWAPPDPSIVLVILVGLMLILQNGALMLWKSDFRTLHTAYLNLTLQLPVLGIRINAGKIGAMVISLIAFALLAIFLNRTTIGIAMRALAQDREAARMVGINTQRLDAVSFGLGVGVAAVAGNALVVFFPIFPLVGIQFILKSFVIVVLGGMGSILGSLVGGLLIGVVESISGTYLPSGWENFVVYALFVLVLLLRPQGLFGKVTTR
jgi:branched-chain amino acid transport system permease protein